MFFQCEEKQNENKQCEKEDKIYTYNCRKQEFDIYIYGKQEVTSGQIA